MYTVIGYYIDTKSFYSWPDISLKTLLCIDITEYENLDIVLQLENNETLNVILHFLKN